MSRRIPRLLSYLAAVPAVAALAIASPAGAVTATPQHAAGSSLLGAGQARAASTAQEPSAQSWPTFHGSPSLQGVSPDTKISDTNAARLGLKWMYPTTAPMLSSPVVAYDATRKQTLAYIGNNDGDVEAIDVATGAPVWSDTLDVPIYGSPTVYDGSVWVGTFVDGHMYKINASTGAVQCDVSLGTGTDLASPTVATPPGGKATVYFGVQDNGVTSAPVTAVDEASCKVDWKSAPFKYAGSGSWNPTSFGVDAHGTPLVFDGTGDPDSSVYALNADTGAKVWSNRSLNPSYADVGAGVTVSPPGKNGFADGMVYYAGKDRILYAIDMTTGKTVWTFNVGAALHDNYNGGRSAAALVGNELVFGDSDGAMAVNAVTGKEIWSSATTVGKDTEVLSSPLITGPAGHQVVVYGDLDGRVLVLSLASGKQLYSFQTHGYIVGSPADSDGNIVITSSDGFVYDLGLGGSNSTAYPSTSITSPTNNSTVPYPGSASSQQATLTVRGKVTTSTSCKSVIVAVQENGAAGPWWNASTAKWQSGPIWNHATLGSGANCSGGWSLPVPVPREGAVLAFYARAVTPTGQVDPKGAISSVTVSPATNGPHLKVATPTVAPGASTDVTGGGFKAGEKVTITLPGGVTLATATAGSSGNLPSTRVTIPRNFAVGLSGITGIGKSSGLAATAPVYVTMTWAEQGQNAARTNYEPNDRYLSEEETPGKVYRLIANTVYDTGAPVNSSAAVYDLVAYAGNNAGDVEAISTTTGSLVWKATTGGAVDSSPAIDPSAGLVVVGSDDDNVYAFNSTTGATVWKTATKGAVDSSPAIVNGVVYVGSSDGKLYALKESTGAVLWTAAMSAQVTASPAVDSAQGEVVASNSVGDTTAFATGGSTPGKVLWTHKAGGAAGTPLISGGLVYVGAADGNEYALSVTSGAVRWTAAIGGTPASAATLHNVLYVGSSNGTLEALDGATGKVAWKDNAAAGVTGVAVTNGILFIECANGTVAGYRIGGENVWLANTRAELSGTPSIVDNAVIVGAGNSGLYVYTPFGRPMV